MIGTIRSKVGTRALITAVLIVLAAAVVCIGVLAANSDNASSAGMARDNTTLYLYSTTSMRDSGLMQNVVLPAYSAMHPEITVVPAYVGSGAALAAAAAGNADVVIAHQVDGERALMASNDLTMRLPFAYNHFTLVGPPGDPAHVKDALTMRGAFKRIATYGKALEKAGKSKIAFVSRGDASGTNVRELQMWYRAGVTTSKGTPPTGTWYQTSGQGMSATIIMADQEGAYTLTDTSTWWNMKAQNPVPFTQTTIKLRKAAWVKNQYSILLCNGIRHDLTNSTAAEWLAMWMISAQGQKAIGSYVQFGHQLYYANAYTIATTPMTTPTPTPTP